MILETLLMVVGIIAAAAIFAGFLALIIMIIRSRE